MKKRPNPQDTLLGVTDFLRFMYDGQPDWSLFAVKASIDRVSSSFAQYRKAKAIFTDVPRRPFGPIGDALAPLVAVVQISHSSWSVVFRSLLWLHSSHLAVVPQEAGEMSLRLKTCAITFIGEDTSSAMGCEIFENGRLISKAEWDDGHREANAIFRKHGIYLPSCYPRVDNGKMWLAVDEKSASAIQRADLIDLGSI